jgi:hypothetical protein
LLRKGGTFVPLGSGSGVLRLRRAGGNQRRVSGG